MSELFSVIGDIEGWIKEFNPAHSAAVEVVNQTSVELKYVNAAHSHGDFGSKLPATSIAAGDSDQFVSGSAAGSVGTGCEGTVTYRTPDGDLEWTIHWDNPFMGSNSADCTPDGSGDPYQGLAQHGGGNDAQFRFTLTGGPKDSSSGEGGDNSDAGG